MADHPETTDSGDWIVVVIVAEIVAQSVKATTVVAEIVEELAMVVAEIVMVKMEGADGMTIRSGGSTSWAASQPHRQAFYGRAIALWP
jgi:hypothetical protein